MHHLIVMSAAGALGLAGCRPSDPPVSTPVPADSPTLVGDSQPDTAPPDAGTDFTAPLEAGDPGEALKIAIIGDFGTGSADEAEVAELVHAFDPDAVLTTGDNNYPVGAAETIDANVGQFYARYIVPYGGTYDPGTAGTAGTPAATNRFWPCAGNHDWDLGNLDAYLDYFELPHNERYYAVELGAVEVFCVDSDPREPDGTSWSSVQGQWLRDALAASTAPWQLVYMHHPPYSSGTHGDNEWMWWPWEAWGADAVWAGHDHDYERIQRHGVLYGITGIGGTGLRSIYADPTDGSEVAWTADHGATLVTATAEELRFRTVSVGGVVIDDVRILAGRAPSPTLSLIPPRGTWRYLDGGVPPAPEWVLPGFDDGAWSEGAGQLGYGDGDEATVVGYGPDPEAKHVTTWFRHTFHVDDPTAFRDMSLGMIANDGALVRLNGVELARPGLPAGPIGPGSVAVADIGVELEIGATVPADALLPGENVLSVEIHLWNPAAEDLGFDLWLTAEKADHLLPFGATWRYHDDREPPPADWYGVAFDDSAWPSGAAPLGYGGDPAPVTVIDAEGDPLDRPATTWYRSTFDVADPTAVEALLLELVRADGAVVWLNGEQIYRVNVPDEVALDATEHAAAPVLADWVERPTRTFLDPSLLVEGTNVVAVAVRVADSGSTSDEPVHRFDLALLPFP